MGRMLRRNPRSSANFRKKSRCRLGMPVGTETGKQATPATRFPGGAPARAFSMDLRISCARQEISAASALGLATVSIRAAVSPKSFRNRMGPAP